MITKTITLSDRRVNATSIKIGNEGDNNAERIKFVLPARLASASVFLFLSIDNHSDVVKLDDDRTFTPERKHTQYPGKWTAYLQAVADGDIVWHSDTFPLLIGNLPPTGEQIEQQYPTAIEEALKAVDTLTGTGARAESVKPTEEASVQTIVDEDGNRILLFGVPRGVTFMPVVEQRMEATGERWLRIGWRNDGDMDNPIIGEVRAPAGVGIKSIEQTTTSTAPGGVNVVTVTLTNGETAQFEVRNGYGGTGGGSAEIKVDNKTIVQEDGVLRVNTTDKAEADNTQPITSAGVYTIIGNINAILKSI